MTSVTSKEGPAQTWEVVSEGVTRPLLRAKPGEQRVLIQIEAGCTYPHHAHAYAAGSYSYYPPGTAPRASSPAGCTILVWNAGK